MYVKRKLYGYHVKSVHKGKEYYNKGRDIVQEHGKKLGRATFIIDATHADSIISLFDEKRVKYKLSKVWA
jgi:hypothetical protein